MRSLDKKVVDLIHTKFNFIENIDMKMKYLYNIRKYKEHDELKLGIKMIDNKTCYIATDCLLIDVTEETNFDEIFVKHKEGMIIPKLNNYNDYEKLYKSFTFVKSISASEVYKIVED